MDCLVLGFFCYFFLFLSYLISKKFNIIDKGSLFKIHQDDVPTIGGIALIPLTLVIFFYYNNEQIYFYFFFSLIAVLCVGLIDDLKNLKPGYKLLLLCLPSMVFVNFIASVSSLGLFFDMTLNLGFMGPIFTFFCLLLLTNSINYIDGIDGLLSFLILITLIFFLLFLPSEKNYLLTPFFIFLLIYLPFNFGLIKCTPKIFLGDTGSLTLGFLISGYAIIFTEIENFLKPSVVIWPLAFYVYEFLSINIIRFLKKKNPLKKDLNFIFNILSKKFSKCITNIICLSVHLIFCLIGIVMNYYQSPSLSIILFITIFFIFLIYRIKQAV